MTTDPLCHAFREWLPGAPEADECLPVELVAHLDTCTGCRAEQAAFDALERELAGEGPLALPAGLGQAIARRLVDEHTLCEVSLERLLRAPEEPDLPADVAAHAAECARCQREAEGLAELEAVLRRPAPDAPPGLQAAIMTRVRAVRSRPAWLQPVATVAAMLLVSALVGLAVARWLPLLSQLEGPALHVPSLDATALRQAPAPPSFDWLPERWPTWRGGPIWPLAGLLALLWLCSNVWLVRGRRTAR